MFKPVDMIWISFRKILKIPKFNEKSANIIMCIDFLVILKWLLLFSTMVLNVYDFKLILKKNIFATYWI